MPEYSISLTRMFPNKDRIYDLVLKRGNYGSEKTSMFHAMILQEKIFNATLQCLKRCYGRPFGGLQNISVAQQNDIINNTYLHFT